MRQCGNVGRRALRSGAPAVTPSVSAQAGNARPRFHHCRIAALPHYRISILTASIYNGIPTTILKGKVTASAIGI